MNIQMVFDEAVLKFILQNNLLERCRELINLSEVLPSLREDQEVIDLLNKGEPCFLWSCSSAKLAWAWFLKFTKLMILTA